MYTKNKKINKHIKLTNICKSKRNMNIYKYKKISCIKGGSRTSKKIAMPDPAHVLTNNKLNTDLKTLKDIITNKDYYTHIYIYFKNIIIKCSMGKNIFVVGNIIKNKVGILIKYNTNHAFCTLESFFFTKTKAECKENSNINNSKFSNNLKNNKGNIPNDYNKKFNEILMELIDIINTNMDMQTCKLRDGSFIQGTRCGDISLNILKHFERGYGFYNEFGYIYKEKITESNKILININKTMHFKINSNTNINIDYITSHLTSMGLEYKPITQRVIDIFNEIVTTNAGITYSQFVNNLLSFCKLSKDIQQINIFNSYDDIDIIQLNNLITIIIHDLLGGKLYSLSHYKLYNKELIEKDKKIYKIQKSELQNKNDNINRKFIMNTMKNYDITIVKRDKQDIKTNNNVNIHKDEYNIIIT